MVKFKFVRQHDSMECGIASIAMICIYYGKNVSLSTLSRLCVPTNEGASLKGIQDAAKKLGFETVGGYLSIAGIMKIDKPLILHWNQNHFVVLYKITRNGKYFHIADPAKGKIKYTLSDFKRYFLCNIKNGEENGIAMYFEPTSAFYELPEERLNRHSVKFLMVYFSRYKKCFVHILAGLLLGSILQLCLPFLTQSIVDLGISHKDINLIWLILLGEMFIVVGRATADFIRRRLLLHISMRINVSLVSDFFIKLLKLPMAFFDRKMMGDLLQRINDHTRIQAFMTGQTLGFMFTLLNFVVFGIILLYYNLTIFFIFLIGSIVYGMWISFFLKRRRVLDYELFSQQAKCQDLTYQFILSLQEIKLHDCEKRRRWEWEDIQADLFSIQMKSLQLNQAQEAGGIFINEIKNILITIFSATLVINGSISLGAMLAIQYIVGQLNSPVAQFMTFIYALQDVKISLERINELHLGKEEDSNCNLVRRIHGEKIIKFKNVDFKYDPHSDKKTLDNVSFDIPEGKVTAIVGASGSGKTTLIKLMLGYYPVLSGSIYIASNNITELNLKSWRRCCGVVMQDGVIFSESIARNIAVDDGDIDWSRLYSAASIANIHDYIDGLPSKYDTKIGGDGRGLSQGQKQRVLIARAIYKDPDFIFLDEATNALDAKNERTIVENLNEFYEGRTVVIVAHRLSTVRNANQIIVMDNGKIVEKGKHSELISRRGAYFNLIKNQLELGGC